MPVTRLPSDEFEDEEDNRPTSTGFVDEEDDPHPLDVRDRRPHTRLPGDDEPDHRAHTRLPDDDEPDPRPHTRFPDDEEDDKRPHTRLSDEDD